MNNIEITYKENSLKNVAEQAAGFPPFTKGYSTTFKKTELISKVPESYFQIQFTEESIMDLFKQLNDHEIKSSINLIFNVTDNITELAYIAVLRTLFCFFLKKKGLDYHNIHFIFWAQSPTPSLLQLNMANAAGIDYFFIEKQSNWSSIKYSTSSQPVDALYGNKMLQSQIDNLFFSLKKNMHAYLF